MEEYQYLWDGSEDGWAILLPGEGGGVELPFNVVRNVVVLIESESLLAEVMARMRAAGVDEITEDQAFGENEVP